MTEPTPAEIYKHIADYHEYYRHKARATYEAWRQRAGKGTPAEVIAAFQELAQFENEHGIGLR